MKVLIFGEYCIDKFVYGHSKRLSPEAPVPVFVPDRVEENPGMAGNVFENVKKIYKDSSCIIFHQVESITKTRYVDDKSNHMFLRVDEGEKSISPLVLNDDIRSFILDADIVIVSDYNKGFLSVDNLLEISKLAKLSILDAKKKLNKELIEQFTFIKLNEFEADINQELIKGFEHKLLITLGVKGCKNNFNIYPAINPQVTMDVSGAGDTFTAAFIIKYHQTQDVAESIKFANKMASIVVSKRGVKTP